jgi:transcriptional regulator with XRE-family HTH domain
MTARLIAGELGYDSNSDLARKAGVSRSTVSRMLCGRRVGLSTVHAVLAVLKLPYGDVVSEAPMPAEDSLE